MLRNGLLGTALLILSSSVLLRAPDLIGQPTFEDIAERAGAHFVLRNGATGKKHLIEPMTGGVAILDYNNDGWPDLYFVNGATVPGLEKIDETYSNRLYRNNADGTFSDVTRQAGVGGTGYSMGVAVGDYNNDGSPDIFVAGVGVNTLYRNRGDGSFEDATAKAHLSNANSSRRLWSVAAGWFDYDADGKLDLFVVNYLTWNPENERVCPNATAGYRIYCDPRYYEGLVNSLYHNNGDGTFTDVSAQSGIGAHKGKGMSATFADYDGDGKLDIFVTNDTMPNFLFHNEGGGRFRETALEAGVALNDNGQPVSSMGVDFRDYNNDGRDDLIITALAGESFPVFRNLGSGIFKGATFETGVARAVSSSSGWSTGFFDFNNDGYKDLFTANGDVQDNVEVYSSRRSRQPNLMLMNRKNGTFQDCTAQAGAGFKQLGLHRGAAFGDLDRDGKIDIVVTRLNEPAEILRNITGTNNNWLTLLLEGRKSNRDGIGARVEVADASGLKQWNHVTTAAGYASSSDRALHFGLGRSTVARVAILWPSGQRQKLENVHADQVLKVREP
ncbi:MAG TPA: CRTAC1 family protein [Acidobacteriota bacterium]